MMCQYLSMAGLFLFLVAVVAVLIKMKRLPHEPEIGNDDYPEARNGKDGLSIGPQSESSSRLSASDNESESIVSSGHNY